MEIEVKKVKLTQKIFKQLKICSYKPSEVELLGYIILDDRKLYLCKKENEYYRMIDWRKDKGTIGFITTFYNKSRYRKDLKSDENVETEINLLKETQQLFL